MMLAMSNSRYIFIRASLPLMPASLLILKLFEHCLDNLSLAQQNLVRHIYQQSNYSTTKMGPRHSASHYISDTTSMLALNYFTSSSTNRVTVESFKVESLDRTNPPRLSPNRDSRVYQYQDKALHHQNHNNLSGRVI